MGWFCSIHLKESYSLVEKISAPGMTMAVSNKLCSSVPLHESLSGKQLELKAMLYVPVSCHKEDGLLVLDLFLPFDR